MTMNKIELLLLMIACALSACVGDGSEWAGREYALTCDIGSEIRYLPMTCAGDPAVIDHLLFLHLDEGSACRVRLLDAQGNVIDREGITE
jgi:hypothetical protein